MGSTLGPIPTRPDHRARVGAERREQMRLRLIASAMVVYAGRVPGADGSAIEDVIRTAKVSRGSFYNHFRTNEQLFLAVAEEAGNQLLRVVEPVLPKFEPGAARVACGVRLTLALAQAYPWLAAFLGRAGPAALGSHSLANKLVVQDVADAMAAGQFTLMPPRLAFDLIVGPVFAAFHTLQSAPLPPDYAEQMARAILQSLGVEQTQARQLASLPLGEVVADSGSLLARAAAMFAEGVPGSPAR